MNGYQVYVIPENTLSRLERLLDRFDQAHLGCNREASAKPEMVAPEPAYKPLEPFAVIGDLSAELIAKLAKHQKEQK